MYSFCRTSRVFPMNKIDRVSKTPAYRQISKALMHEILEGRLRPGEMIPTEAELCQVFGVNRSTVREGMRRLEENGMLRRSGGKRLMISRPTEKEVGDQIARTMVMHAITFREIWEAMMAVEPNMARLAARIGLRPEIIPLLQQNLDRTACAVVDGSPLADLDMEFHTLVAHSSANRALLLAYEPLRRLLFPTFKAVFSRVPLAGSRLLKAHRAIMDALTAGDAAGAGLWMEKHIQDFRRGFRLAQLDLALPVTMQDEGAVTETGLPQDWGYRAQASGAGHRSPPRTQNPT